MAEDKLAKIAGGWAIAQVLRGSWREPCPRADVTPSDVERCARLLLAMGCGPLAWRRVSDTASADTEPGRWLRQEYRRAAVIGALRARHTAAVVGALREWGVDPLLAKGWAIGRDYPGLELRPFGDIDLYLGADDLGSARAALARACVDTPVELHVHYNQRLDRPFHGMLARARRVSLYNVEVSLPRPEDHLRLLCLHMLGHGVWRALWLVDVAVLVERAGPEFDWDLCLAGNRRYSDWVACSIGLAHMLLGARVDHTPVVERARSLPGWLAPAVLRQWEVGSGSSLHAPLNKAFGKGLPRPTELMSRLRVHWRNPVEATCELGGPFNNWPRLPYQVAAAALRAPDLVRALVQRGPPSARSDA